MYKNLTLINGLILAVMVFFNSMLSSKTGPYMGTLIYHALGLALIIVISIITRNKLSSFRNIPLMLFLPGLLSVATIFLNNLAIPEIGITLSIGVSLFGQLVMSAIVEHFGLFGMARNKLIKEKLIGFSVITIGIVFMIVM